MSNQDQPRINANEHERKHWDLCHDIVEVFFAVYNELGFGLPIRRIPWVAQTDLLRADVVYQSSGLGRLCGPENGRIEDKHQCHQRAL